MELKNDCIPTEKELALIAKAIGRNWEILGIHLGLSTAKIEQIQMDYDTSLKRIHRMLLVWKQMYSQQATFDKLYEIMKEEESVTIDWDAMPGVSLQNQRASQYLTLNEDYLKLKNQLKKDLIDFNQEQLETASISPVREEIGAPLLELYVSPTIKRIGTTCSVNQLKQTTTLDEIFHKQGRRYQHIYISAEAGLGKTIFAKRLALIWCHANDPTDDNAAFSDDELSVMKDFEFVFFVSLKDLDPLDCTVDDMITNQVIHCLARSSKYSPRFVEDILSQEKCLVILDGLDEWTHPVDGGCKMKMSERKNSIPHKKSRATCTFLTTTRPWKLLFAYISNTKIEQQFEIVGLDETASEELKAKVTEKLKAYSDEESSGDQSRVPDFEADAVDQRIESIKRNPMLIMYMACLQNENRTFGSSMCALYSNILEMMLQRTNLEDNINTSPEQDIPECFKGNEYCQSYFSILRELGHLAFLTLFTLNGKSRLVFENSLAKQHMSEAQLRLWLKTGILTQVGFHKQLTGRNIKVSFVHKTFHEFFAALYMCMKNADMFADNVMKTCRHVNHILEMKSTFAFLSGFCSNQSNMILRQLTDVVANDTLAIRFRKRVYPFRDYWEMCDITEEFQSMMVDCVNESSDNNQTVGYYIEDVILHSKHKKRYICALKQLLRHVKLIKVGRQVSNEDTHELLEELNLFRPESLQHLQKLDLWGTPTTDDINLLLSGSAKTLKCLLLHGCKTTDGTETSAYIQLSDMSMQILKSLERLEGIDLFSIEMKHHHVEKLVKWLEQRKCMAEIKLSRIRCSDHASYVKGKLREYIKCKTRSQSFDLSKHENLITLGLGTMRMPAVKINASTLEECWLERNENLIMYLIDTFASSPVKLHTLVVEFVEDQNVINSLLSIIPKVPHLRHLQLKGMDFQERDLVLSQRDIFKHIRLIEIAMTSLALERLVEFFKACNNSVTTELSSCNIKSGKDEEALTFDTLKRKIETSSLFDILYNLRCSGHGNSFAFKTLVSDVHN